MDHANARGEKMNDGQLLYADGTCRFRVWAPFGKRVQVVGDFNGVAGAVIDLAAEGNGSCCDVPGSGAVTLYRYRIENVGGAGVRIRKHPGGALMAALQVENSGGGAASYVVPAFDQANRPGFRTPGFDSFILYQLQVGSFAGCNDVRASPVRNRTATFVDVIDKLSYIRDLGFNGIALLPIGEILGDTGVGYGTCDIFAPEDAYATSKERAVEELLRMVDEVHCGGLAVIFDVVYNHPSVGDNRYWRYDGNCFGASGGGEYFESGHDTRFGVGFATWKWEWCDSSWTMPVCSCGITGRMGCGLTRCSSSRQMRCGLGRGRCETNIPIST